MDLLRLGIVYLHLIACCVALGLVLTSDLAMVKRLMNGDAREDPDHLDYLQKVVSGALAVLWLTGIAIISLDATEKGWEDFLNPKLQAKMAIVLLLVRVVRCLPSRGVLGCTAAVAGRRWTSPRGGNRGDYRGGRPKPKAMGI